MNDHDSQITILGLDPSTVCTGWALLEVDGDDQRVASSGVHRPPKTASLDHDLLACFEWLHSRLDPGPWQPGIVAMEVPYLQLNPKTLIRLAQVGTAYRLAVARHGIPLVEVAASQRGPALGLAPNAHKDQIRAMVNLVYNLRLRSHDQADAVAIAAAGARIYHESHLARLYANFEAGP